MDFERELTEQMKELGQQVKQSREFRRLTLATLARQADIGVMTLVRIEDGNPAVGMLNLHKVLRVLGLPQSLVPPNMPSAEDLPCHPLHIESKDTEETIENAVSAACEVLDEWLGVKHPERNGISSNFQGLLRDHVAAMLCGKPGASRNASLKCLVYSDDTVGGPMYSDAEGCMGWALRVRGESLVLQGTKTLEFNASGFDPYSSRENALAGLRKYVEKVGHPPGPVDAVPVFRGEQDNYRF